MSGHRSWNVPGAVSDIERNWEVSVMSNAPYGYRYLRKTDEAPAAYIVDEAEARVVRRVYDMYTVEGLSIGEITRRLNTELIATRKASRWERSGRLGFAAEPSLSRLGLLRQDPRLCTDAGYAPKTSAGCNYAQ